MKFTLDMPKVVLILGLTTVLGTLFTGASLWLIAHGYVSAAGVAQIVAAVTTILTFLAWAAEKARAAYLQGKNELPSLFTDPAALKAAQSMRPPAPSVHDLAAEADRREGGS